MNSVNLIGRLTTDVVLKKITVKDKDFIVADFGLAVQRRFKNKFGVYDADFIYCVLYGKAAETFAKFVKKGQRIGLEGSFVSSLYDKNGETRSIIRLRVNHFDFLEYDDDSNNNALPEVDLEKQAALIAEISSRETLTTEELATLDEKLPF